MPKIDEADIIGAADVCDLLSIDRSTLSRWVAKGHLTPIFKAPGVRGAFFFSRRDIETHRNGK